MNQIITYKGEYYYVNRTGARLANTWLVKGGKRYYITGSGKFLRKSWMKSQGKYYYLGVDGHSPDELLDRQLLCRFERSETEQLCERWLVSG